MSNTLSDRALLLIGLSGINDLAKAGHTDYPRWVNIKRGRARVGADEIEILGNVFPNYRWWLMTGDVMPEIGQTSPDYDDANRNLSNHDAG